MVVLDNLTLMILHYVRQANTEKLKIQLHTFDYQTSFHAKFYRKQMLGREVAINSLEIYNHSTKGKYEEYLQEKALYFKPLKTRQMSKKLDQISSTA